MCFSLSLKWESKKFYDQSCVFDNTLNLTYLFQKQAKITRYIYTKLYRSTQQTQTKT